MYRTYLIKSALDPRLVLAGSSVIGAGLGAASADEGHAGHDALMGAGVGAGLGAAINQSGHPAGATHVTVSPPQVTVNLPKDAVPKASPSVAASSVKPQTDLGHLLQLIYRKRKGTLNEADVVGAGDRYAGTIKDVLGRVAKRYGLA